MEHEGINVHSNTQSYEKAAKLSKPCHNFGVTCRQAVLMTEQRMIFLARLFQQLHSSYHILSNVLQQAQPPTITAKMVNNHRHKSA